MAEPVFKLLRCDAEASHMLGWAKKQVKRLVEHAKLDSFQRSWSLGDVSIRANYFGGVARLWLEAAGTERMAVWATLPNPYPYRGLSIARTPSGVAPQVVVYCNFSQYPRVTTITMNGVEYGRWVGTQTLTVFYEPGCAHASNLIEYSNFNDGVGNLLNGSLVTGGCSGNPPNDVVVVSISSTPEYMAAVSDAQAIAASTIGEVVVIASDGEVLAQETLNSTLTNDTDRAFVPEGPFAGVNSFMFPWNGGSRVAMYFNGGSNLSFDHWLDFIVPEDVAFVPNETPPTQVGVTARAVFNGLTYEYVPFGGSGGSAMPLSAIQSRTDEWAAGVKEAKARRAAWFKKNSDEVLQTLKDGVLPDRWDYKIKYYAPESDNTYRPIVLSASYDDETVSDTSADLTQVGTQVQERTVEFTYVVTVNGTPETREETVVGTLTSVVTAHKDVDNNPVAHSLARTYTDWYAPAAAPVGDEALLPHQFLKDGTAYGMGLVWNGAVQRAYGGTFPSPTVGNWEYYADSTLGTPGNGLYPFAESGYNPPISAAEVSPAYPPESNTLVGTAPAFVRTYHADVKPQYRASGGKTDWLSSSLMPDMTIMVVPIAPVIDAEPLGIYGEPENITAVAEVEIYGAAVFSYNYNLGEFVFVEWKPLPGDAESARIPLPSEGWNGYNALIIYGGIKWDDVKEKARAQRKALNDPNDPNHDPLMKAVLDALKEPEPAP